ncbi:MAG: hypothetical protein IKP00_12405 [Victivallales bacterium]|nr:hypothetical protein [Victivallales bacterium]
MKLCIFLLLFLLYGCSKRETVPYDNRRSLALLDACEAILKDDNAAAMGALQQMETIGGQDDFSTETQLAISRRQDFDKAEELLRQRDYQGLRLFLAQCKASGRVGAELDGFEPLPDALEQLELFRSRMPWESSVVLKDALEELEPYLETLSQSPSFDAFFKKQQATLKALQAKEAAIRAKGYLSRMERALVSGSVKSFEEARLVFREDQPDHSYFQMEGILLKGKLPLIKSGEEMTFAVALVTNWAKIKGGLRAKAVAALKSKMAGAGICALYAKTLQSGNPEDYEALFCMARDAGYGVSGVLVRQYIGKLKLSGKPVKVTPWPGIYETVEFISNP